MSGECGSAIREPDTLLMRRYLLFMLPPAALVWVACSVFASRGAAPMTYQLRAGAGTPRDIVVKSRQVLVERRGYQIERIETAGAILAIETRWKGRYPMKDEIDRGVVEAMTRFTLTARARQRQTGGLTDLRTVQLSADNMVLLADSLDWVRGFMTAMFKAYVEEIARELKTELETGVRTF